MVSFNHPPNRKKKIWVKVEKSSPNIFGMNIKAMWFELPLATPEDPVVFHQLPDHFFFPNGKIAFKLFLLASSIRCTLSGQSQQPLAGLMMIVAACLCFFFVKVCQFKENNSNMIIFNLHVDCDMLAQSGRLRNWNNPVAYNVIRFKQLCWHLTNAPTDWIRWDVKKTQSVNC